MKYIFYIVCFVVVFFLGFGLRSVKFSSKQECNLSKNSWNLLVKNADFSPRDSSSVFIYKNQIWLSNGYYTGNLCFRDLWYTNDGLTWVCVNTATPYDPYSHIVVYDEKMWAVGNTVWNSVDGKKWIQIQPSVPVGRGNYNVPVIFNNEIWTIGGRMVWKTTDGVNWVCINKNVPVSDRGNYAYAVYKNKLWIIGGGLNKPNNPPEKGAPNVTTLNDVWCSDDGITWKQVLKNAPWCERLWPVAVVCDGKLWIVSGYDAKKAKNLNDMWYTEDGQNWKQFYPEKSFSPRNMPSVFTFKNNMWLIGGNTWPVTNEVWKLILEKNVL